MEAPVVEGLSRLEADLLMELQYGFPRGPRPFHEVAEVLGEEPGALVEAARGLASRGILKRIGFYLNYRSQGLRAALVAYAAGDRIGELASYYRGDPLATHVYRRDHPVYDLWVVTKRGSLEEVVGHARRLAEEHGVDYVVLYSRRTYKLSVKYDLYRGVSRSGPYAWVAEKPPRPEDLGVPLPAARLLRALPIDEHPYRGLAARLGVSEREAARIAWRLLDAGVLGDPGAALDGHRAGFEENAMVVMEPGPQGEDCLCRCAAMLPFTTHVVLRGSIPEGKWTHTCYFMVHAVDRARVELLVEEAASQCGPRSLHVIRSLEDLKPGVVR